MKDKKNHQNYKISDIFDKYHWLNSTKNKNRKGQKTVKYRDMSETVKAYRGESKMV